MASALATGTGSAYLSDAEKAGWNPDYSQFWVGEWMNTYGWGGLDNALSQSKSHGATPLIEWYYWGDSISKSCVQYGCSGKSRGEWNAMAKTLAQKIGSQEAVVVLETEFNKGDIGTWSTFDGYLQEQIKIFRTYAPNAKIVIGFGHWGSSDWGTFSGAVSKSDGVGFEVLRATTRYSSHDVEHTADFALETAKKMKSKFNKPVYLHDVDISSYGGESLQEKAVKRFNTLRAEFDAAGLEVVIWRDVRDSDKYSTGDYFQAAEFHWGLLRKDGSKKPAWDDWVTFATSVGSSSSTSSSSSSTTDSTSSTSTSTSSGEFRNVKGNEWWIQVNVDGATSVSARVDGGSWKTLTLQTWGAWATSTKVPTGSIVEFRASLSDGRTVTSGGYKWPDATPTSTGTSQTSTSSDSTSSASTSSGSLTADFTNVKGNEWWVQANVKASKTLSKVEARVDGGSWKTLTLQTWGAWAAGMKAPTGSVVELRATATDGSTAMSGGYNWPDATPTSTGTSQTSTSSDSTSSGSLTADFTNVKGNEWWVQANVKASKTLSKVEARVDGGSWETLTLRSWGAWAAGMKAPTGSTVELRATATDGSTALSGPYTWPQ